MTHPLTPPTTYDLFVSYRRKDAKAVHAVVAALRDAGVSVFLDTRRIEKFYSFPRAAWECSPGRAASRICCVCLITNTAATLAAARRCCIPTQRVGTRFTRF